MAMRPFLLALLLSLGSLVANGQSTPDCQFTVTFTSATTGASFNNRTSSGATPCVKWRVAYFADGLSGASIQLEGANDSNGTAGSYAAIAQANVYEGTNPLIDPAQGTAAMTAYFPWIRLNVTVFTPTGGAPHQIIARVYGYKGTSASAGSSSGSGVAACSTTPPTTGTAGTTCYDTAGLLWVCDPSAPCTVAGDWVPQGFSNPMNTLGDMIYGDAGGTPARVPGNTSAVQKVLAQTGDGSNSAEPVWAPPQTSGTLTYYLQSTNSGLTNGSAIVTQDKQMLTPPQAVKTNIDIAHNASGDVILQSFATDPGFPGITFIPFGAYIWHIHAERLSGNRAVTLYAVFREVTATGTNVGTIGTLTESTTALTGVENEYPLAMADPNPYFLALSTSRIVIDCHAVFTGGSTSTTVRMFVGGTADSHISLPSNTVDSTYFVPYTGATNDVALGLHAITGAPFTGDSGSGGTTGLVPAPAAGDAAAGKYLDAAGGWGVPPGTGGAAYYQTVDNAGTPLTQRPTLNFAGAGVSCADNSGATRTDCTINGGGGGFASEANIIPPNQPSGTNSSWRNYSIAVVYRGINLLTFPASWKVRMLFTGGNATYGAIVVKRTLTYSLTVINTTAMTIGGNASGTLTSPGLIETDAVSLQLDSTHDYWVIMFFSDVVGNASLSVAAAVSQYGGATMPMMNFSDIQTGDHTGDTTIPSWQSAPNQPYLFLGMIMP
jgi:hypothetical protein